MDTIQQPQETTAVKKRKRGAALLILLVLILLAAVAFLAWKGQSGRGGLEYEENVVVGSLPGKSAEERLAELNELVAEGMVSIAINSTPCTGVTEDGQTAVNWLIENPANQGKLIRVEVTRNDTGEVVYHTGAIKPGSYVEAAPLDVDLAPGAYLCTAMFYTYRLDTEEAIGQAGAEITLTVS